MQCPIGISRRRVVPYTAAPGRFRGPFSRLKVRHRPISSLYSMLSLSSIMCPTPHSQHLYVIRRKGRFSINCNRDRSNLFRLQASIRNIVIRPGQQCKGGTGSVTTVRLANAESRICYICWHMDLSGGGSSKDFEALRSGSRM
jgi:hypothetical protein